MNRVWHSLLPVVLATASLLALAVVRYANRTTAAPAPENVIRCAASRDVWLSAVEGERHFNMGAAPRLKLKQWQEFALVDFDVAALAGRTIQRATLYLKPAGGHRLGLNAGTDLRWLTVSTVTHDWIEGEARRPARDPRGRGATFHESSYGQAGWGFEGAKVWDVILGNGNSTRFDGRIAPVDDGEFGWQHLEIEPSLVQALVTGASFGLALADGSTDLRSNSFVGSRESASGPFLEIELGERDTTPPMAPSHLRVDPAPNWATPTAGAAEISLMVPADTFSFDVRINNRELARQQIPLADPSGQQQSFTVVDLPAESELSVEVSAVDAAGNRSPFASASGRASPALVVPRLPSSPFRPVGDQPPAIGNILVWAFPEVSKVDPVSAEVLAEPGGVEFRRRNAVWDGASRTIRVAAARGEIVSFQVAVEGRCRGCRILVSALAGPGLIEPNEVRLWRNWYVGRHSEYALPLEGTFDVPSSDNRTPGQTLQAITVDLHVPKSASAGEYQGTVRVNSKSGSVDLRLHLQVYDVVLPDTINFNVELNTYKGPGRAGSRRFIDSFRLAHYHRATINRVPYFQDGTVHNDWIPEVDDLGRVRDWSDFDENLGGLLDGSWFSTNPRPGVPVPTLYLPFFEGWPLDYRQYYHPGPAVPVDARDPDLKLRHDTLAEPIHEAFDESFERILVTALEDFVRHFREEQWNRTLFHFYLNNKPRYGYTMWTLDEPFEYLDWAALNYFARLVKRAVNDPEVYSQEWHSEIGRRGLAAMNRPRPTILFRADISRPMWQGSVSDGLMNAMYVSSAGMEVPRLMRAAKARMPVLLYSYGTPNEVNENNWRSVAWCLKAFVLGYDGVLPWQSLGDSRALEIPTTTALLIDAGRFGDAVASLRLHALRRGAQDSELLRLAQLQRGWSRLQVGLLVEQKVALGVDDSAPEGDGLLAFGLLSARDFLELKEGVLLLLTSDYSGKQDGAQ